MMVRTRGPRMLIPCVSGWARATRLAAATGVVAVTLWAGPARATSLGLDASFVSDYVWRGARLVKGPAFQPEVDIVFPGDRLHLNLWTTLGFQNDPEEDGQPATAVDRVELVLDYTHPVVPRFVFVKVGGVYYINPGSDALGSRRPETVDIVGGVIVRSLIPVDIHLDANFDADETKQLYVALSVAPEFSIGAHRVGLSVRTALTSTKPGGAESDADRLVGASDTAVTAGASIAAGWLRIRPHVTGVFAARRANEVGAIRARDPGKDRFLFGVDFGFAH